MRLVDPSQVGKLMKYYGFSAPDMTITEFVEDELTTIDAVPVVRCRECIYCSWQEDNLVYCDNFERDMMPDDFCSVGAKKEAAHD